jgi:hypothetical protein
MENGIPGNDSRMETEDERRMIKSGAWECGYRSPTLSDVYDIRKDHSTHSAPDAVSADEAIREVRGTAEIPEGNLPPPGGAESSATKTEDDRVITAKDAARALVGVNG